MNKKILMSVLGVVIIVAAFLYVGMSKTTPTTVKTAQNKTLYCGSEGQPTLVKSIQSHRSYCISSDVGSKKFAVNTPGAYSFSIIDDEGNIMKDFAITHTKPMHVIVVRKDLKYFQHVHPEYESASGKFSFSDLTFPADGEYRIFADFAASKDQGGMMGSNGMPLPITISEDVMVGNAASYTKEAIGGEERTKIFSGVKTTLAFEPAKPVSGSETKLTYSLTDANNLPIKDLETYLGALGHAVVLREGTLDFIHAHPFEDPTKPQNGKVNFMVYFPEAGKYKVFTQFQRGGNIITTDFVLTVTQGATAPNEIESSSSTMMH